MVNHDDKGMGLNYQPKKTAGGNKFLKQDY